MDSMTDYERERAANIAANKALLEKLKLDNAAVKIFPKAEKKPTPVPRSKSKPVQSAKRKRETVPEVPLRQSTRLRRTTIEDPNESPDTKRIRTEKEHEERLKLEERREAELDRLRAANQPRHQDLDLTAMAMKEEPESLGDLKSTLAFACEHDYTRHLHMEDGMDEDIRGDPGLEELKEKFSNMVVKSRAKVTDDRVYSSAYHPERMKDLIFFGDKHGQLGIWDAQAPPDEGNDEDNEAEGTEPSGKAWRLQPHWPATAKSSISSVRFDPLNAHNVFTTSYDCTLRVTSFETGVSRELYALDSDRALLSSLDIVPAGNELWISDTQGGVTRLDIRESSRSATRWQINEKLKIGCISLNPVSPHLIITASNDRTLKLWDARKLPQYTSAPTKTPLTPPRTSPSISPSQGNRGAQEPRDVEFEELEPLYDAKPGKKGYGLLKGEFTHGASASSAYWDPSGRRIVSTSYDNTIRVWDLQARSLNRETPFEQFKPRWSINHNCQTGQWLTILRAQWSANPDVHPHFTIGNLKHSLDIFSYTGQSIAKLYDPDRITATQAVTCSHPLVVEHVASGNATGRCVLWTPADD